MPFVFCGISSELCLIGLRRGRRLLVLLLLGVCLMMHFGRLVGVLSGKRGLLMGAHFHVQRARREQHDQTERPSDHCAADGSCKREMMNDQ